MGDASLAQRIPGMSIAADKAGESNVRKERRGRQSKQTAAGRHQYTKHEIPGWQGKEEREREREAVVAL